MPEEARIEREALSAALFNQTRTCERPVLRGTPIPGSTGPDTLLVVEGGDLTNVAKSVEQAVAHGDGCSPYLPGRRGVGPFINLIRATKVLVIEARERFARNDSLNAVRLLLDGWRFCQDFARGGVSELVMAVSQASTRLVLPTLEEFLNQARPLGPEVLDSLNQEITILMQTEPHPSSVIDGEYGYSLRELRRACPPERTVLSCYLGVSTIAKKLQQSEKHQFLLGLVAGQGENLFLLAAARLHAGVRQLIEQSGSCPPPGVFESPPLSNLRRDPYTDLPILVERTTTGYLLRSPVPDEVRQRRKEEPVWRIRCPESP